MKQNKKQTNQRKIYNAHIKIPTKKKKQFVTRLKQKQKILLLFFLFAPFILFNQCVISICVIIIQAASLRPIWLSKLIILTSDSCRAFQSVNKCSVGLDLVAKY